MKQQIKRRVPLPITRDTWVISDLHLGHRNIIEFEPSRLVATEEGNYENQEEMLIAKWNAVVKAGDHIIILGDYAFKGIKEYTRRLNGNIELVRGNHDKRSSHAYYDAGFSYVYDTITQHDDIGNYWHLDGDDTYLSSAIVELEGTKIALSHYALDYYEDYTKQRAIDLSYRIKEITKVAFNKGVTVNIHGHLHSKQPPHTAKLKYLNVSCENLDFTPIKLGHLLDASGILR